MSDGPTRDDHAELLRRRALTEDAARTDAVERRHASNGRTARENIDDLIDAGTFVEYGRFVIAAQRFRRDLDDLIARTPADGLVAGTACINGVQAVGAAIRCGAAHFADEAEAVVVTKRLVGYFQGATAPGAAADQTRLRTMIPERDRRAYDVGPVVETLVDEGSVTFLRPRFAREMVTALARIEGRAVGVIANDTRYMAGAITAAAADKAARFLQLCDSFGIPLISLIDCPGYMVGPAAEADALVRRASRMLVAGAALRFPLVAVVLRRGYGLGAQAMTGGSLHEPLLTVAWPGAHLGPMGLEGAVRLGLRKELEAITDDDEREERVRQATEAAQDNAKALNAAQMLEIDDVIDPADTRRLIAATLTAATAHAEDRPPRRFVDTW
jgi:acetyl-CoA carboxylase carboxyltransferase component